MYIDFDLLKEYINTKHTVRYRVEVVLSARLETINYSLHSTLNNSTKEIGQKFFWVIIWSGWRVNYGGQDWVYKNNMRSLRFNYESFQEWVIETREKKLSDLI